MKRTLLLIMAALLSCAALSAQDKIYFIDSRVVDALVDEVGEDMVYYRAFANQYGPTYSASVYSIAKIVYQNGYVQEFGLAAVSPLLAGTTGAMRYENGKLYLGVSTSGWSSDIKAATTSINIKIDGVSVAKKVSCSVTAAKNSDGMQEIVIDLSAQSVSSGSTVTYTIPEGFLVSKSGTQYNTSYTSSATI